ncbi:MAG: glycosyl hydrolase family 28 protein [Bacteroidales bacterium]
MRPLSSGIKPLFQNSDSIIRFRINKPGKYSVELNGGVLIPLFLFANPAETIMPYKNNRNVMFFEKGKIHYPGTIILKDNQEIFIEEGAIVVGTIKGRNAKNVKIRGLGILDGSYSSQFMDSCATANKTNAGVKALPERGGINGLISLNECSDIVIEGITIYNSKTWDVVSALCNRVAIDNIKIISDNGGDDGIDVVSSKNVKISNSFIRTKDDCIAIKSFAKTLALQSQQKENLAQQKITNPSFPPLPEGPFFGVDSVMVTGCVFWNALWGNSLEIGFELSGDISNVRFIDNDIIHTEGGAAFIIHNARRGVVRNILVDNLRVEGTDQKLFDLAIFRSYYSEDGARNPEEEERLYLHGVWDNVQLVPEAEKELRMKYRGHIRDIMLRNVALVDGPFPFSVFYGSDKEHLVENAIIENLTVYGKKIKTLEEAKFYLENTKNIIIKKSEPPDDIKNPSISYIYFSDIGNQQLQRTAEIDCSCFDG